MSNRLFNIKHLVTDLLIIAVIILSAGCHTTRHLDNNQFLLKKNRVVLRSDHKIAGRSEVKDNLSKMILQKPNSRFAGIPFKLLLYNRHYNKLHTEAADSLPKSVERPVIVDSALMQRTVQNMKNFLNYQGYFYAKVKDTFIVKHQKAFATYTINTGINYRINKVNYFIEDSAINRLVLADTGESLLQKHFEFKPGLLEDERSRITALIRNNGYYKFTQENINFFNGIDTGDKSLFKNADNPFEGAVNYTLLAKGAKKATVDIDLHIQLVDDSNAFTRYKIASVHVYPDYNSPADLTDTTMITKTIDEVDFKYHNYFVHPRVLYQHIYLSPGSLYAQSDYDKTSTKLNDLNIFQYIRIVPYENPDIKGILDYDIFLKRAKKHDFSPHYDISSGSTYSLGNSVTVNYRDKNLLKGANLLTIGVNGGVELAYNDNTGNTLNDRFSLLTEYYGANASIDFPKFLAPIASSLFDNSNLPHTIIGGGENVMDRVNYFTLLNTSANFSYSWRQTPTITWSFSPVFINVIRLPIETDSFKAALDSNAYLRDSYKQNFIEGENISFTFDNLAKKHGINYSYIKLGFEEAGGILGGLNQLGAALNDLYKIQFAQYTKYDFDARHYFTLPHSSVIAMRFYGGVGIPYGQSDALPYIKQYFAGGPYSLRGWRIRTLGPGSNFDNNANPDQIDRTGDIKLEYNTEYRFPIAPLFAGAVRMNGALFFDAGNIWLARPDPSYPGGNFTFNTLGQDIAADIGIGTRFDIASFLTLRVDVAMPVKEPYVSTNSGWVFNQVNPYDPTWRANNIVFNISIGYPF